MAIDMQEVNDFLKGRSEETKVYVGCDSQVGFRGDQRVARYTTAIVVHIDGSRGAKIFHETSVERDYSPDMRKPSFRLMNEVYKVSEKYLELIDNAENCLDKDIHIHLDISPYEDCKSNMVVQEAIGYVRGVCQVDPEVKPDAWAASTVADRY